MSSPVTGGHTVNPSTRGCQPYHWSHRSCTELRLTAVISYADLVDIYWRQTDPTDAGGQFQDRGDSYRPVIFINSPTQRQAATASKEKLAASGQFDEPIVTSIEDAQPFYPAEDEHQDFYRTNPFRYQIEEMGGRQAFIAKNWQD